MIELTEQDAAILHTLRATLADARIKLSLETAKSVQETLQRLIASKEQELAATARHFDWKYKESTWKNELSLGQPATATNEEAIKDFPHLTRKDVEIGKVRESTYMKHFKLVEFSLPPGTEHEAYKQWKRFDFER